MVFTFLKIMFSINTIDKMIKIFKSFSFLFISFVLSPIVIFITIILVIYKSLIYLILKYQYGSEFSGFLEGSDNVCNVEDSHILHCLQILESNDIENLGQYLINKFSALIKDSKFEKISYTRNRAYGYSFWKKDQILTGNDIVTFIENTDNSGIQLDDLQKLLTHYSNQEFFKNNTILFQLILVKRPIIENNIQTKKYAMIFRFHHLLLDGRSFIRLLQKLSDNSDNQQEVDLNETGFKTKIKNWINLKLSLIIPTFYFIEQSLIHISIRKREFHLLFRPKLSGEKLITWKSDNNIINTVKLIRKHIPNTSFATILFTALSDSLAKYFSKNSKETPETIQISFPLPIKQAVPCFTLNLNETELQNNFTAGIFRLPITYDGDNTNILTRLIKIKDALKIVNYRHILHFYWFLKVFANYLPDFLLKFILSYDSSTIHFSNFVFPSTYKISGFLLTDIMWFMPNKNLTGISMVAASYNGLLSFSLVADQALISKQKDLDDILDNIFLSIKNLEQTVSS